MLYTLTSKRRLTKFHTIAYCLNWNRMDWQVWYWIGLLISYLTEGKRLLFVVPLLNGHQLLMGFPRVVSLVTHFSFMIYQSYVGIFADDTKIYRPITSLIDYDILQSDINSALQWYDLWLSFLNSSKYHHNSISSSSSIRQYYFYSSDCTPYNYCFQWKKPGCYFWQRLNNFSTIWNPHLLKNIHN